jgi:hypothetical protein
LVNQPLKEKLKQRPQEEVPGFFESLLTPKGWERKPDERGGEMRGIPAADEGEWSPEDATSLAWDVRTSGSARDHRNGAEGK